MTYFFNNMMVFICRY